MARTAKRTWGVILPEPHHGPYLLYDLRQNLARYLDEAVESRAPLLVTRQNGKGDVVMLSPEEFASWQETVHLLGSPRNAERLMRSIRQLGVGQGEVHELVEKDQTAA